MIALNNFNYHWDRFFSNLLIKLEMHFKKPLDIFYSLELELKIAFPKEFQVKPRESHLLEIWSARMFENMYLKLYKEYKKIQYVYCTNKQQTPSDGYNCGLYCLIHFYWEQNLIDWLYSGCLNVQWQKFHAYSSKSFQKYIMKYLVLQMFKFSHYLVNFIFLAISN